MEPKTVEITWSVESDVMSIAKRISDLSDDVGINCDSLCSIIKTLATGLSELRERVKKDA